MARKRVSENPVVSAGAAAVPLRRKTTTTKRATRPAVEVPNAVAVESPAAVSEPIVAVPAPAAAPGREVIAQLAYSFWVSRGCQGGSPEEDWLRAEQQLTAMSAK